MPLILFLIFAEDETGRILVVYTRTVWLEHTVVTDRLKLIKDNLNHNTCICVCLLSRPTNAQHKYINNI